MSVDTTIKTSTMKLTPQLLLLPCFMASLISCNSSATLEKQDARHAQQLFIEWELISNQVADEPRCRSIFQIRNEGDRALSDHNWAIYFNQDAGNVIPGSVTGNAQLSRLGGDFYCLSPDAGFELPPGEEITIEADHRRWLIKEDQAPLGIYIVFMDEDGKERSRHAIPNYTIRPFTRPEQLNRFTVDQTPDPTPQWQYARNERLSKLDPSRLPLIIPSPASMSVTPGDVTIDGSTPIRFGKGLESEASFLAEKLEDLLGTSVEISRQEERGEGMIHLSLAPDMNTPGSYQLAITGNQGISILGADAAGVFYGVQSLLALVPPENYAAKAREISIPACTVEDAPRFPYRGMHLDVSRNFNRKEAVFKLVDVMSFYKLNKLHLHLTDDEGWRLQIRQLPELTEVGAFRGHTLDDHEYLHPAYGSGPEPDPESGYGSGYYTREDFMEILTYAHARHMEVIPEFDLPGHARAAIKAMDARYRRFMKEGDEEKAKEFLLSDPDDRSEYSSAQGYDDNVICVCRESAYRFIETVVEEVTAMYREADVPLYTIHIGGDEVPRGSWMKSPICTGFLEENAISNGGYGLMDYFLSRTSEILKERDLVLSGWEEITLERDETGYTVKAPQTDPRFQVYIWDNFTEGNQDIGYKIANAGYPIVLCSVTNFYFELAYNKDPREPGNYWGGFVDTYKAFEYIPFDVYKSIHTNPLGWPYDPEVDFQDMVKLNPGAEQHILGLQGELWSEPIKGPEMLEYFYLPKLLGLAERAWSIQPEWATQDDAVLREKALTDSWNSFANALGQRELPRLDHLSGGYNYRIPPPGIKVEDGILYANTEFPGLTIRYTTDGSEPTENSAQCTAPVQVEGGVRARTLNTLGRGSRCVVVPEQ
jgi:hexosaminidase